MSYTIYYSDPAKRRYPLTVHDSTVLNGVGTGGISLVGRTYPGYGQAIAENFIHMLENSASPVPPINPIEGQLWYDSYSKKLKINEGSSNSISWKPINGIYQQPTMPADARNGDLWVDTTSSQLYVSNGSIFRLIGPKDPLDAASGMIVEQLLDTLNQPHDTANVFIADQTTNETQRYVIISKDTFAYPDYFNYPDGIKAGINLKAGTMLNGSADAAYNVWQDTIKVSGNLLVRNDISQKLNGQITIATDGSALKIGAEPTFILERTLNGTNANFTNSYQGFGTFSFNIKDNNYTNLKIMTIGGDNRQVKVISTTTSVNPTTGALVVAGGVGISGDLNVNGGASFGGKTVFNGEVVFVNTATNVIAGDQAYAGAIFTIHVPPESETWAYTDGKDVGLQFKYYNTQQGTGTTAALVMDETTNILSWYETGDIVSNKFVGTKDGTFTAGLIRIRTAEQSSSTNTGALVVAGGAGFGENVNIGGSVAIAGTMTVAGSATLNNISLPSSGFGVPGQVLMSNGSTSSAYWGTIALNTFTGGLIPNQLSISTQTQSNSTITGALVVSGGAGFGGNLTIGGSINVSQTATFGNSLTVNGGSVRIGSTSTMLTDNMPIIHNTSTSDWVFDDGMDIGVRYRYYNRSSSTGTDAALVLDNTTQQLVWYNTGYEASNGKFVGGSYGGFKLGTISLTSTTPSTSTMTGALTVGGGAGFGGTVYAQSFVGPLTGNATTASKLQNPVSIGGVSFDGSASISLPGVNTTGTQSTTGNAATATKLQTPFSINGVQVDGSVNVTIPASLDDAIAYAPIAYPGTVVPIGYLAMMGQPISQVTYPKLYALYGPTLPDMRGYFIRGWDNGRGLDAGRTILSTQADSIISHNHTATVTLADAITSGEGPTISSGGGLLPWLTNTFSTKYTGESETRPKNIAFNYIVKAG